MPTIQVTIPRDDLDQNQKSQLVQQLTESISEFYITEKNEQVKEFVNIRIHETSENGYAVGGDIIG
ncbi:4-oxalocrotonate tautomerase family enzyme [Fodinibius roseus]|uniref:4-oxalocrotonate tautomerase family enzyme n=1 Tax=Fodinibius roseus TaxID=1194090 RepID=A0A1M4YPM9_9BACT|nr:tautomerase family protein [Fodinibius roseus]SHF07779.1 4-oxalocrotonate tautomerase family enzyme [Fodinibius roseus]